MRLIRFILYFGLLALAGIVLLASRAELPPLDNRTSSRALPPATDSRLGRAITPRARAHPGQSGIFALDDGADAFAARALLADAAEQSIDIQYYIWQPDRSGTLLFDALRRAADRGVRVRLLLDDNNTAGLDPILAALHGHPNIEVRLFNPFVHRRWRVLGYLTDLPRLNRRMHNKSFTVDGQATIIGGRNVGDEYFGASDEGLFIDLDALAVGPVVGKVSEDFDRYWASGSSYPADRLLPEAGPAALEQLATEAAAILEDRNAATFLQALHGSSLIWELLAGHLPLIWADTLMVSDDPAKGLGMATEDALLLGRLAQIMGAPQQSLRLVSAYFVPAHAGTDYLTGLARRGVKVAVLTNALEATDVTLVHAGYAKRRRELLAAGVTLFEMKRGAAMPDPQGHGLTGSSDASLHAKTFTVDRERIFIGSFNFDPRSARLNTELGFLIDSPALAQTLTEIFREVPASAYEVRLDEDGRLQWLERDGERVIVHTQEPGTSLWRRLIVWALSWLPIDWLL